MTSTTLSQSPTKQVRGEKQTSPNGLNEDIFRVTANNSGAKNPNNNNTSQINENNQAAANALADLFQDEENEEDYPQQEEDSVDKNSEILNDPQSVYESNTQSKSNGTNNAENSFAKVKKMSPKNSPVDLYGCDEMSQSSENGRRNSGTSANKVNPPIKNLISSSPPSETPTKFQFNSDVNSNTAGDLLNSLSNKANTKPNAANDINNLYNTYSAQQQTNTSSSQNGLNENLISQIMSNSSNNNTMNSTSSQQSNYSNVNYLMRRERSLDRGPATENFIENFLMAPNSSMRRSYNASNQSPQTVSQNTNNIYANVASLYNSQPGQSTKSLRQNGHHRSNSILNTNSITSANPLTNLSNNNSNLNRDYGNGILIGNGLRSSARALSSTSFSTQNFQRDPSATSLKSLMASHGSNGNLNDYQGQSNGQSSSKLNFIKDLQIRLMDMQKECYYLRCELDSSQQKLTASMQSIKQFWSPELKRERQQRKEESGKYSILLEQYKILQNQYQQLLENYEQQSNSYQQLQMQLEQHNGSTFDQQTSNMSNKQLLREKTLLKKTINELEIRITTQKQSLCTKDETIKKLFHLVKSASNKIKSNDIYATSSETMQYVNDIEALTTQLEASNANNLIITEQHNLLRERLQEEERKSEQLKQLVQQMQQKRATTPLIYDVNDQNNQVKALENQVRQLQEELNSAKLTTSIQRCESTSSQASPKHSNNLNSSSQVDLLKANEKLLKERIETLKYDLSRRDTELQQLKSKFEACESKEKDLQHYLNLLKESISTKDQQITMQQSEINDLRGRIRDKDTFIEKKNQHLQAIQLEKHQRDSDIGEIRDQMDIKERKINVLNRKIENLEDQLKDKEMQITTIRSKLGSGSISSGSMYHANLMKTLDQKDKVIEKLTKDLLCFEKQSQDHQQNSSQYQTDQVDRLNVTIKDLNEKLEYKIKELENNQNEIYDLKDEIEMLKTQLLRKDSHVNSLELSLTQKNEEIDMIEEKLTRVTKQQQQQLTLAANNASQQNNSNQLEIDNLKKQLGQSQKELTNKENQVQNLINELNTLKEIIDEFEGQKQLVKAKLEQQQNQFAQLEKHFEATTVELEGKLREQKEINEQQVSRFELERADILKEQQKIYEEELRSCEEKLDAVKKNLPEGEENLDSMELQKLNEKIDVLGKEKLVLEERIEKLNERIKELEEALRESVSITAEREFVFGQQKKKNEAFEEDNKHLQEEIKTMQRSLYEQQCEFNRYQEELNKREEQLQRLEEEKVEEMNQLLVTKQELLLSTISEKDALIGSLECDRQGESKETQNRIQQLNDEKDYLHQQLKELNEKRMKLMQDHMTAKEAKDKVKLLTLNTSLAHEVDGITG